MFLPINEAHSTVTLDEFLNQCLATSGRQFVFRGQADASWPLAPSGFRAVDGSLCPTAERNRRIREFQGEPFQEAVKGLRELLKQREDIADLDGAEFSRLQLMVIAQHFGVPTPLLDWTLSPLIAAYMAYKFKRGPGEIAIFRMDQSTRSDDLIWAKYSQVSFKRISSQLGGITCFGQLSAGNIQITPETFEEYFAENSAEISAGRLDCFISKVAVQITAADTERLTEVLECNGIKTENLFPDSGYWRAQSIRETLNF